MGMDRLDRSQGRWAVSHVRDVVESTVWKGDRPPKPEDIDDVFETERGAFVTLEKAGELRGCIGRPRPEQSAISALREAAVEAATSDPRFPPVAPAELESITVEISVLTPPEPIDVANPDRYPEAIEVGRDGLIVAGNNRVGLLLPQVATDRDWEAATFLRQACLKAGLPRDSWRAEDVRIERFGAQVFAERTPGGQIEAKSPAPAAEP
ncbi:MAG: AmmeMemoRadiSam system protein A [Halodesulfurarchaeum sp.]